MKIKFNQVNPGTLFRVRAICSFAEHESDITNYGNIVALKRMIEVPKGTLLMLIEANWLEVISPHKGLQLSETNSKSSVVLFHFLIEDRSVFLPIQASFIGIQDPAEQVLKFLELYIENIDESVQLSKKL